MSKLDALDRKLRERLLLGERKEGDHLVLADDTLRAALDGGRRLTPAESAALQASPLTLRRLRQLSSDYAWAGSTGMLRAAADQAPLQELVTDDGHWRLHFVEQDGAWRIILALDAGAPFAAALMRRQPLLRVVDGGGAIALQGRLDADGECETEWPFQTAPAQHFQLFGARFAVEPAQ